MGFEFETPQATIIAGTTLVGLDLRVMYRLFAHILTAAYYLVYLKYYAMPIMVSTVKPHVSK
jgi:hypothetical protein